MNGLVNGVYISENMYSGYKGYLAGLNEWNREDTYSGGISLLLRKAQYWANNSGCNLGHRASC